MSLPNLEDTLSLCLYAHKGQVDKSGNPYILHPIKVMMGVNSIEEKQVALLHDVIEDSEITLDDLRKIGYPETIVSAVDALTKRPGESRMEAAVRTAKNQIAIKVKLSDLDHNMDLTRLPNITQDDIARQAEYFEVKDFLINALKAFN